MESVHMLVEWVEEQKFSIVKRTAIVDTEKRNLPDDNLIGKELLVLWKSNKAYKAVIIQCGDKVNLSHELEILLQQQDEQSRQKPENNISIGTDIHAVIQNILTNEPTSQSSGKEAFLIKITNLERDLKQEREKAEKYKNKYRGLKRKYNSITNENAMSEVGAGVYLPTSQLDTILSLSDNSSKLARNLLRALFTDEELFGRSLFGLRCNANKDKPTRPGIDEVRRDAIISFVLNRYGGDIFPVGEGQKARNPLLHSLHATMGDFIRHIKLTQTP